MDKPNPPPTTKMHAYVIMLHLRSQGWTNFTEIRKLFCWKKLKMGLAINSVGHINHVIDYLSEKWGEDIPKFNAFVFTNETQCTAYICKDVLPKREGVKCHRLFRPKFRKVKRRFFVEIREVSDTLTLNVGVSGDTPVR